MASLLHQRRVERRLARRPLLGRRLAKRERSATAVTVAILAQRLRGHGAELLATDEGITCWFYEPGVGNRPEQPQPIDRHMTDGAMRELWTVMKLIPGATVALLEQLS